MLRICLIIGHNRAAQGAQNTNSAISEFAFNDRLVQEVVGQNKDSELFLIPVYRTTYEELPDYVNACNPHFAISFHCNAFNSRISGTETLYYHNSKVSKRIASIVQSNVVDCLCLPDRGIKPRTFEDRGGHLLRYVKAPVVICESFFIDNDIDLEIATKRFDLLARSFLNSIHAIMEAKEV